MPDETKAVDFDRSFVAHMDSSYNLARWLVRDHRDARDVGQEAYLPALQFAGGFQGGDPRAWILAIVRNTGFTQLRGNRSPESPTELDEKVHRAYSEEAGGSRRGSQG
jgi:DNA-directed RNA polymerase specialized sigma24 family protein